ncbi:MAG: translation initiation factor IF-2 subunit gamma, partial [Sulfolobales archaeon]|nr:translation initiation factor IF-2 subunit gamma [Sulfolobales archaeon]MDW8010403.1 translation initiation factor IF-2 subunit gamma [Sulfolobales archaeon]
MERALKQPEMNIGVVGHVDHGKTTLVQAITGIWTSKHSEELLRSMTIKLGYADTDIYECLDRPVYERYTTDPIDCSNPMYRRSVSFVDSPGHEVLMANMLSGAAIMDSALLVIAANEPCPQPQTREHFMALEIIGVKNVIVVQNKVDVVTRERAKKNYEEIRAFLAGTFAENAPVIPVSALHGVNIDVLLSAIEHYFKTPERDLSAKPMMFIARSFDVNKPGTPPDRLVGGVVGGSVIKGVFKIGDEIEISPGVRVVENGKAVYRKLYTRVESIRFGDKTYREAMPGGLVAVGTQLDPSLTKADKLVGSVVGLAGYLPQPRTHFTADYKLFERVVGTKELQKVPPMRVGERIIITAGTAIAMAVVRRLSSDWFELELVDKPVIVWKGMKIAISRNVMNRWRLV